MRISDQNRCWSMNGLIKNRVTLLIHYILSQLALSHPNRHIISKITNFYRYIFLNITFSGLYQIIYFYLPNFKWGKNGI